MLCLHRTLGVAVVGASLIAVPHLVPLSPGMQVRAVRLTSGDTADSPLGDGTAFILGGSGLETPGQTYANVIDAEYLAPRDFTGTTQVLTTPEALYPFLGPFTETFDQSEAQGQQILDNAILNQIATGDVDAAAGAADPEGSCHARAALEGGGTCLHPSRIRTHSRGGYRQGGAHIVRKLLPTFP